MEAGKVIFYTLLAEIQEVVGDLLNLIFESARGVFFNGVAYSLIGIVAMFWLLKRLHKGGIDKEDAYQALIWITIVCFVYTIMHSQGTYYGFLRLLDMPINYVTAITAGYFENATMADAFGSAIDKLYLTLKNVYDALDNVLNSWWKSNILVTIIAFLFMTFFWIMAITYLILIIAITCIVVVTKFMATIILCASPIMIPFLIVNQLRGYFFSWFKLYLHYSLIAPVAMIVGNFPLGALDKIDFSFIEKSGQPITENITEMIFKPLGLAIIAIIGIMILVKVPSWINQVLGTQNSDGVGLAPLKAAAMFVGSGGAGSIAGYTMARAGGASWASSALSGIKEGAIQATPLGKSLSGAMKSAKDKIISSSGITSATEGFLK